MSANNFDIIHVSPRCYVKEFRSLAVAAPPLQIKYLIFIRIASRVGWKII